MITLHYCSYNTDTKKITKSLTINSEKHTKVYSKYFFK